MYSFKCGDDIKNQVKVVSKSQSTSFNFGDHKKCLYAEKYQRECETYILRSGNHEMYLQQRKKSTLSFFDVKRCYENRIKSLP